MFVYTFLRFVTSFVWFSYCGKISNLLNATTLKSHNSNYPSLPDLSNGSYQHKMFTLLCWQRITTEEISLLLTLLNIITSKHNNPYGCSLVRETQCNDFNFLLSVIQNLEREIVTTVVSLSTDWIDWKEDWKVNTLLAMVTIIATSSHSNFVTIHAGKLNLVSLCFPHQVAFVSVVMLAGNNIQQGC